MADSWADRIANTAVSPKRAKSDEGEFEQHSIPDQIAADRYCRSLAASKSPRRAVRLTKFVSGGTQ